MDRLHLIHNKSPKLKGDIHCCDAQKRFSFRPSWYFLRYTQKSAKYIGFSCLPMATVSWRVTRIATKAGFMHGVKVSGIITSVDVVTSLRIARRCGQLLARWALHILAPSITHTIDHTVAVHSDVTTLWHSTVRGDGTGGVRYERRCIGGTRHFAPRAVPGAQQLTGGAGPPLPPLLPLPPRSSPRALLAPARAAGACHTPRLPPHPTSNPLFTDGRPVSGAFAVLHDERSNLMPFLCPASNAIRLRTSNIRISDDWIYLKNHSRWWNVCELELELYPIW